jgi:hypothetical protein
VTAAAAAFTANWLLMSRRPGSTLLRRDAAKARRGGAGIRLGEARYLTTVARLPVEIAGELAAVGSRLLGAPSPHYVYPPDSIHLTVLGLAGRPGLEAEVGEAATGHAPFGVEVGGLNLSGETIFAELYPVGRGLMELREGLRHLESHEHGPISRWVRRRIAHANLIRFRSPVERRLVAGVGSLRRESFGRFEVESLELVHTDKVMSKAGTRTLGRYQLG